MSHIELLDCESCGTHVGSDIAWGPDGDGVYLCPPCAYEHLSDIIAEQAINAKCLLDEFENFKQWARQQVGHTAKYPPYKPSHESIDDIITEIKEAVGDVPA